MSITPVSRASFPIFSRMILLPSIDTSTLESLTNSRGFLYSYGITILPKSSRVLILKIFFSFAIWTLSFPIPFLSKMLDKKT